MKRKITCLLLLLAVMALTACDGIGDNAASDAPQSAAQPAEQTPQPPSPTPQAPDLRETRRVSYEGVFSFEVLSDWDLEFFDESILVNGGEALISIFLPGRVSDHVVLPDDEMELFAMFISYNAGPNPDIIREQFTFHFHDGDTHGQPFLSTSYAAILPDGSAAPAAAFMIYGKDEDILMVIIVGTPYIDEIPYSVLFDIARSVRF